MEKRHRESLRKLHVVLIKELDLSLLLHILYQEGILQFQHLDEIKSFPQTTPSQPVPVCTDEWVHLRECIIRECPLTISETCNGALMESDRGKGVGSLMSTTCTQTEQDCLRASLRPDENDFIKCGDAQGELLKCVLDHPDEFMMTG